MEIESFKGETLDDIAYRTKTALDEIVKSNPHLTGKFKLSAGEKVFIPAISKSEKRITRLFD